MEKNENPSAHLRWSDAVLQVPGRVQALHVCLFSEMGRELDHGRPAGKISAAAGKGDKAQPVWPSIYEPEPRIAFQRRGTFFEFQIVAEGRWDRRYAGCPLYLCRNQLLLVQKWRVHQAAPPGSQGKRIEMDRLLKEGIDLANRPVLRYLIDEDMKGLLNFALDLGYQELDEGYVSKCHLCLDIRQYLVSNDDYDELKPTEFYEQLK